MNKKYKKIYINLLIFIFIFIFLLATFTIVNIISQNKSLPVNNKNIEQTQTSHPLIKRDDKSDNILLSPAELYLKNIPKDTPVVAKKPELEWYLQKLPQLILIDKSEQKLTIYENGKIIRSTPVTTGDIDHDTPIGEFEIYKKEKDMIINSPFPNDPYRLHVNYWLEYSRLLAIHDASWRKNFGTLDYQTLGSHGCINTPDNQMEWIYNWSSYGTTVKIQE
jgi:lipoprotein-anchoring transpeptidase ErfK/SrfK